MGACYFFPTLILGGKGCPRDPMPAAGSHKAGWHRPPPLVPLVGDRLGGGAGTPLCRGVSGQVPSILTGARDRRPPTGRFCDQIQSLLAEQAAGGEEVPSPTQPILEVRWGHRVTWGDTRRRVAQAATPHLCLQYSYEYSEAGKRVVLGRGTYGVVYAGRCLSNQVRIAIKEIPERDSR